LFGKEIAEAISIPSKHLRGEAVGKVEERIVASFSILTSYSKIDPSKNILADSLDEGIIML
jgi:hypothetical protein